MSKGNDFPLQPLSKKPLEASFPPKGCIPSIAAAQCHRGWQEVGNRQVLLQFPPFQVFICQTHVHNEIKPNALPAGAV